MGASSSQARVHSVADRHVTVFYPSTVSAAFANTCLSVTEQIYKVESDRFRIGTSDKMRVRICGDGFEFSNLTGSDSIAAPLNKDGVLYLIRGSDFKDVVFKSRVEAGVIRIILDRIRINGAPWWLIHSAAVYESGQYKDCGAPPIENVQYFADLDEKIQNATTPSELNDLCFYFGATGRFFDFKYGSGSFIKLIQQFNHPTTMREAARRLFHADLDRVEQDWHDFLASQTHE